MNTSRDLPGTKFVLAYLDAATLTTGSPLETSESSRSLYRGLLGSRCSCIKAFDAWGKIAISSHPFTLDSKKNVYPKSSIRIKLGAPNEILMPDPFCPQDG